MKKFIFSLLFLMTVFAGVTCASLSANDSETTIVEESVLATEAEPASYILERVTFAKIEVPEESIESEEAPLASAEDIELLALLAMAEAEGECEEGQRLVIDVVLNRADNPCFPDTIYDVVYQKNQFSGMYGERISQCYVKDELVQLVQEELTNRTNYDVIYFRTKHYHSYGVPLFQVGAHYFSSYD